MCKFIRKDLLTRRSKMKKIIYIALIAAIAMPVMAGFAFAGDVTIANNAERLTDIGSRVVGTDTLPACDLALSKNVSFGYNVATDFQSYAIQSLHYSGDKKYGTASDTTLLFWVSSDTGLTAGAPTGDDSTAVNSGSEM
jgi:hypothetical protein